MEIRKAVVEDASEIANVHVNSWRTTYQRLIPDDYLASLDIQIREARWRKSLEEGNTIFVVVNYENSIVGFANGGENRNANYPYDSELYAIYMLEEAQRQGAGSQLIAHVAEHLIEEGFQSMLVWVLNGNPAAQFYEHLHPIRIAEEEVTIGGKTLKETAFGWDDLNTLVRNN
ncbi:GNAT family N-acetyltransferase [Bacillus sp. NTK071]|uniref:GNAT family N-acetyltransferase n=1 Tax=Bacillus sp. NTK071 TaxID=2802175 RepID=UPI001A8C006F|nr:GNAT family N-acetyltransferase [Bacillus sp. NTK071]MBN8209120.1 GNAT family N-acetyltransferase [Bacillus sp. NTK071]